MAVADQAKWAAFDAPTIGNYLWAYNEMVRKFRARAGSAEKFESALQQLIDTHLQQINLMGGLKDHTGTDEFESTNAQWQTGVAPYVEAVQRLTPNERTDRWRGPLQTLVRTHLYQLGIFGGWIFSQPEPDVAALTADEEGDGLKRCPDGSLVQHGVGCP